MNYNTNTPQHLNKKKNTNTPQHHEFYRKTGNNLVIRHIGEKCCVCLSQIYQVPVTSVFQFQPNGQMNFTVPWPIYTDFVEWGLGKYC